MLNDCLKKYVSPNEVKYFVGFPDASAQALDDYIQRRIPVGGFLEAVLSNNLVNAMSMADQNNLPLLKEYVLFLYNYAPAKCWGSSKKYNEWLKSKI